MNFMLIETLCGIIVRPQESTINVSITRSCRDIRKITPIRINLELHRSIKHQSDFLSTFLNTNKLIVNSPAATSGFVSLWSFYGAIWRAYQELLCNWIYRFLIIVFRSWVVEQYLSWVWILLDSRMNLLLMSCRKLFVILAIMNLGALRPQHLFS